MKEFSNEERIIQMFLDVDFSWKAVLLEQLNSARFSSKLYGANYFIDFSVPSHCPSIDIEHRVPFEIIVDHMQCGEFCMINDDNAEIQLHKGTKSPTGFNLHIDRGFIKEIEVYSLGGDALNLDGICEGKRYYHIMRM